MDALKSAGRAILRSPSLARQPRHEKLPDTDSREALLEGVTFNLKYLGMTLVETPKGEVMAAAAIRRIITMARASAKRLQKVILTVTPHSITIQDAASTAQPQCVSIYRISYCTTDKVQNKVFAYVAQNESSGALECHAFLSSKKKMAQAVTLTVAQAFMVALDLWQSSKEGKPNSSPRLQEAALTPSSGATGPHPGDHDVMDGSSGMSALHRDDEDEEEDDDDFDEDFSSVCPISSSTLAHSQQLGSPEAVT